MYQIIVIFLLIFSAFLPIGVIAREAEQNLQFVEQVQQSDEAITDVIYDFANSRTYQVDGNSVKTLGFKSGAFVDVVPASDFNIGDIIAFGCFRQECNGEYIKKITKKQDACYWVEGRQDIWEEDGKKKQSMDSRTTYGWLCGDDINIYGVAFLQTA